MHSRTSSRRSPGSASRNNARKLTKKSPAATAGLFCFRNAGSDFNREPKILVRGRGELCDQAFVGLEGLLGEIGVESRDLLRFRDEGLVGRAGEFGLRLDRLVHRLHAGQLFNERFGLFERLLGVVAIGTRDRLNAALPVARGGGNRFEMFFSVALNVFNLDHHGVLSQTAGVNRLPGGPGPLTTIYICAPHNKVKKYCATHKCAELAEKSGVLRNG